MANRLNSFQWSLERLLSLAKADLTEQPTAKSSRLKKWKEESQNRRGLSQAANSECTKTFESQEITAVHILQHRRLYCIASYMLASPIFLQTSPGAINWGPGGTVQNLHFCYFLHNELVTDPM